MPRIAVIAHREFTAMVGTKAFLLTLVMMPVLMLGGLVVMPLVGKLGGVKERRIVVADASEGSKWFQTISSAAQERNELIRAAQQDESVDRPGGKDPFSGAEIFEIVAADSTTLTDEQRLGLSDEIREGKLYAFLEIPEELGEPGQIAKFSSQDAVMSGARKWMENHLRNLVRENRLTELGIDPQLVAEANVPVSVQPTSLYTQNEDGGADSQTGEDTLVAVFLPFGVMMLMFMAIFMAAQPMLESGMEEKQHRIAELLLGSASPRELMTGKLLGNVAGSFVVFTIYGVGALTVARYNEWQIPLDWAQLPWLLVFQVLGVLLYSSVFLTIGASVTELKEAQSLLLPVWLMVASPLMVWFTAIRDPNGVVASALSFFPPSAPLMMALRLSSGQALPWWHAPLSATLLLVATALIVRLAARIYRHSLLKSDSAATFTKLFRRMVSEA